MCFLLILSRIFLLLLLPNFDTKAKKFTQYPLAECFITTHKRNLLKSLLVADLLYKLFLKDTNASKFLVHYSYADSKLTLGLFYSGYIQLFVKMAFTENNTYNILMSMLKEK